MPAAAVVCRNALRFVCRVGDVVGASGMAIIRHKSARLASVNFSLSNPGYFQI
jgi:hypothetical protein